MSITDSVARLVPRVPPSSFGAAWVASLDMAALQEQATILASIGDGFISLDAEWNIIYANQPAADYLGRKVEDLVGRNIWATFPATVDSQAYREYHRAASAGTRAHFETLSTQTNRWLDIHLYPKIGGGLLVLFRDITERHDAHEELREHESFYRLLVENAHEYAIFGFGADGNITHWNAGAERLFGFSGEEIIGHPAELVYTPEDRLAGVLKSEIASASERGHASNERWHLRRDGSRFWGSGFVIRLVDGGNARGFVKILRDNTRREALESELRRFKDIFENTSQAMRIVDAVDEKVSHVNPAFARMIGSTVEDLEGQLPIESYAPEEHELAFRMLALTDEQGQCEYETKLVRADGTVFPVEINARAVRDESGKTLYRIVNVTDISARRAAEAAVRESEKRFRSLTEATSQVVWGWRERTGTGSSSEFTGSTWSKFTGQNPEGKGPDTWLEALHPEDRADAQSAFALAREHKEPFESQYRVRRHDGEYRYVVSRGVPLRDASGEVTEWIGTLHDVTDTTLGEQRLRASEQQLRTVVESAGVGTWTWDPHGDQIEFQCNLAELFGLREPLWHFSEYMPHVEPADVVQAQAVIMDAVTRGVSYELEYRLRGEPGRQRWLASTVAVTEQDGRRLFVGVNFDITKRKRAEEALVRSEERFRSLVTATATIVWSAGPDGLVKPDAPRWEAFTGQTPDQYAGWGWMNLIHPEDQEATKTVWLRTLEQPGAFMLRYRLLHVSGEYRHMVVRGAPVFDEDGTIREWVGTIDDVHEETSAQTMLRESEDRFRSVADVSPVMIWMADSDGRLSFVNAPWLTFTGRTLEEESRGRLIKGVHPDDFAHYSEVYEAATGARQPFEVEYRLRRHDGEFRWLLDKGAPRFAPDGIFLGFIGSCVDITESKELFQREQALRRLAETASRAKDEFLATVSHELRTPLNAILGWSNLLRIGGLKETESKRALETIERNARAQAQIIEDILDVARVTSGKLSLQWQSLDFSVLVLDAAASVQPSADAKNITVTTDLVPAALVNGDSVRLRQVVWNLLSNAIKFTPIGGTVDVALKAEKAHWVLAVTDSGLGIPPEFLPYVFDRFRQADASSTRKFGGLGLGLALVRHLTESHGGNASAFSAGPGLGARFEVRLPQPSSAQNHGNPMEAPVMGPTPGAAILAGLRALVVDDSPDALDLAAFVLRTQGARVEVASSASAARELLSGQSFDVLLCDLGMPGEDGYSLIAWVRNCLDPNAARLPAAALTAYAGVEDRARALASGFDAFLTKPLESSVVLNTVRELVGR